jgi:hypothetical protein
VYLHLSYFFRCIEFATGKECAGDLLRVKPRTNHGELFLININLPSRQPGRKSHYIDR